MLGTLHFYRARGAVGMIDRTAGEKKNRWIESALDELKFAQNYEPNRMLMSGKRVCNGWRKAIQNTRVKFVTLRRSLRAN